MKNLIKRSLKKIVRGTGYNIVSEKQGKFPSDFEDEHIKIIEFVKPFTMTSSERIFALIEAVKYVVNNNVKGDIIECGVWKGGSMMAIAKTLLNLKNLDKHLYLYDTFEGMTKPKDIDISYANVPATEKFEEIKITDDKSNWNIADLEDVKKVVFSTGYDKEKIHFVKGKVEDTIPNTAPENISLLRLDTDWYESTRHELIHLFPRLSKGGVLIIDDYGHWKGARKAVDEYISENKIPILLNRIDYTGRIGIKI
jgi:hypothetical protein